MSLFSSPTSHTDLKSKIRNSERVFGFPSLLSSARSLELVMQQQGSYLPSAALHETHPVAPSTVLHEKFRLSEFRLTDPHRNSWAENCSTPFRGEFFDNSEVNLRKFKCFSCKLLLTV